MSSVASLAGIKSGKDLNIEKLTTNLRMATDGLRADDFIAVVPSVGELTGAGTVNAKNAMDFKMIATLSKEAGNAVSSGAGGAAGALGGILGKVSGGGGGCSSSGLKVPFQIQGTTAEPKFIPDIGGAAADLFKSKLGCLGGSSAAGATKAQGQNPADAINALGGLFKKKKP
jgi:AsmA protein